MYTYLHTRAYCVHVYECDIVCACSVTIQRVILANIDCAAICTMLASASITTTAANFMPNTLILHCFSNMFA